MADTTKQSRKRPSRANGAAAARSETSPKPKTIKFEGLTLELPTKLPFRVLKHIREGGLNGAISFIEDVLGEEQMNKVWELDIDLERGTEMVEEILDTYGLSPGESPASESS